MKFFPTFLLLLKVQKELHVIAYTFFYFRKKEQIVKQKRIENTK